MLQRDPRYVLTLSCLDRLGIVHAVSGFMTFHHLTIVDSAQFTERETRHFFMRVSCAPVGSAADLAALRDAFADIATEFGMTWEMHDLTIRPRVLLLSLIHISEPTRPY